MTGLILTLLLFPLAGGALRKRPLGESFLFGAGVIGSAMFIAGVFHLPLVSACAAAPLAFVPPETRREQVRLPLLAWIPIVAIALAVAIIPLRDFDGRVFWVLKAKAIAHDRAIDGPFFHEQQVHSPRNQYPLLLPLDSAAIMMLAGDDDDRQIRWIYLGIFAAMVAVVAQRISPWAAALLAWVPQFAIAEGGGAISAYSDIAVAAFATCAFLALRDRDEPATLGCWLAFLVLTKSEGLPLALILFAIGCVVYRRRIVMAVPMLAASVALLFVWRSRVPRTDEENFFERLRFFDIHTAPRAAAGLLDYALQPRVWGIFWIVAIAGIVLLARNRDWLPAVTLTAFAALYVVVYSTTEWPLDSLMIVSADRLLMHLAAPALAGIAYVINASVRSR